MTDGKRNKSPHEQVPQRVVNHYLAEIFSRRIGAGEKLPPERELAATMKVDRTSLRVALKQLQSMGLLDIRPGNGIYVKDYLKHAGMDFLRVLFSQEDEAVRELTSDRYVIDEVYEWWAAMMPEVLKLAASRFSPRHLKTLSDLLDQELASVGNKEKIVELEVAEQDLVAEVANNMILLLVSNSSRPLRRKMVGIFVECIDEGSLREFILAKKAMLEEFLCGQSEEKTAQAAARYRRILSEHRRLVRRSGPG